MRPRASLWFTFPIRAMGSWRDSLSPQAQQGVDVLLNESLPFGQRMLEEHGEFFPYAVAMSASGEVEIFGAQIGPDENPPSGKVLDVLYEGLRSRRDSIRAAAVVSDVVVREPGETEASRIEIEHREGVALTVLLPYEKASHPRRVRYGDLQAMPASRRVWS